MQQFYENGTFFYMLIISKTTQLSQGHQGQGRLGHQGQEKLFLA